MMLQWKPTTTVISQSIDTRSAHTFFHCLSFMTCDVQSSQQSLAGCRPPHVRRIMSPDQMSWNPRIVSECRLLDSGGHTIKFTICISVFCAPLLTTAVRSLRCSCCKQTDRKVNRGQTANTDVVSQICNSGRACEIKHDTTRYEMLF